MTLLEQLTEDYKNAMRNHEETRKLIINYVLAQVKNKKIELQKDPEDADVVAILKKEIKALNEAIWFLEQALLNESSEIVWENHPISSVNRQVSLDIEKQKKLILESYLPATMSHKQTTELIEKLMKKLGIDFASLSASGGQRGQLMKELMANYKGQTALGPTGKWQVDGNLVNEIINASLDRQKNL